MSLRSLRRREFLRSGGAAALWSLSRPLRGISRDSGTTSRNKIFDVHSIPNNPFSDPAHPNRHVGLDCLLGLLGANGLKFYRSKQAAKMVGPLGMIAPDDVVLIKVNAQWKYRGCTNSDLVRGIIQRILEHPDGFRGEVVIVENGQGWGSLNCDTMSDYPDSTVHANANDERHSFLYLINKVFKNRQVGGTILDRIRQNFISASEHVREGYRRMDDVSFPCFTTPGGRRVELADGIWTGKGFSRNLKLINVPVLKHHDNGGSEITASLKHFYGLVSMWDGQRDFRHYRGLGQTCGTMVASVRTPVLNIVDAVWVS